MLLVGSGISIEHEPFAAMIPGEADTGAQIVRNGDPRFQLLDIFEIVSIDEPSIFMRIAEHAMGAAVEPPVSLTRATPVSNGDRLA